MSDTLTGESRKRVKAYLPGFLVKVQKADQWQMVSLHQRKLSNMRTTIVWILSDTSVKNCVYRTKI